MSISNVGANSAVITQASTGDAVAIEVLKKALDIESQAALQLIQALPQPVTSSPSHMGNSVNILA